MWKETTPGGALHGSLCGGDPPHAAGEFVEGRPRPSWPRRRRSSWQLERRPADAWRRRSRTPISRRRSSCTVSLGRRRSALRCRSSTFPRACRTGCTSRTAGPTRGHRMTSRNAATSPSRCRRASCSEPSRAALVAIDRERRPARAAARRRRAGQRRAHRPADRPEPGAGGAGRDDGRCVHRQGRRDRLHRQGPYRRRPGPRGSPPPQASAGSTPVETAGTIFPA